MADEPNSPTREDFVEHRSTTFEANGMPFVLAEIDVRPDQPHAPRPHPFSLVFVGPAQSPLPQGTYTFRHPTLGAFDVFIVPIGPGLDGVPRYEAVFN